MNTVTAGPDGMPPAVTAPAADPVMRFGDTFSIWSATYLDNMREYLGGKPQQP